MGERLGGREKGTPNKINAAIKTAILEAFKEVGGQDYLVKLATGDRYSVAAFCRLLEKVVPGELKVEGDLTGPVQVYVVTGIEGSPGSTKRELVAEIPIESSLGDPH